MTRRKQEPPFCIQVELTEGCNLMCNFCGLQGIREKAGGPYKFMTKRIAENIAQQIGEAGWNSRMEFAMHGEPTLNPDFIDIIGIFRYWLPRNQIMMTSNGGGLLKDSANRVDALFKAGLNILALDDYKTVGIVPKIRARLTEAGSSYPVHEYPKDGLDISPHRRWPRSTQVIIVVQDLEEAAAGSHAVITNHCGCGAPPSERKAGQRCAKPFREIGIRWDGGMAGCCNDWRGILRVGNAASEGIVNLWEASPVMESMRRKLYAGQRDFGACAGCDYVSYRNGLLPDKLGKQTMPRPTPKDEAVLAEASCKPMTKPVLRPWER